MPTVVEAEAIYKGEHSFFEEVMLLLRYEKLYKMPQVVLCKQTHFTPQNEFGHPHDCSAEREGRLTYEVD